MNMWNPSAVNVTRLTDIEKSLIQSKLPRAKDGQYYADAVFEGGGVKGTAFLGALRCFDDAGIQLRKVAGTSAGAITAAMVAAGFSVSELENIIGQLNYEDEFLSKKKSPFILNGSPEDDLKNPIRMLTNLLAVRQLGQYSSAPFKNWLSRQLAGQAPTFGAVSQATEENPAWYKQRAIKVVISDISHGEMLVLPDDLPQAEQAGFDLAEAVRLSMSIPFFFEPGHLGDSMIVDGGILSNFPLWIYDAEPGRKPNCPTFGFQLVEPDESQMRQIEGIGDLIVGLFATMQSGRDRRHQRQNDQGRIIDINTLGISTTQFNLTHEDKNNLYQQGYERTRTFLLNEWSWQEHLQARGFTPEEIQLVA
ncbi:MAG: patatin-like phospholipase family protein [Cyanobacteria bacterium J06639_14]